MTQYLDPHGPESLVGDPADPMTRADLDALDSHAAQDAAYDAQLTQDVMLETFLAGIAASDGLGTFGMNDPAFQLGEQIGWMIRGAVALTPELAPLLAALVK